MPRENTLLQMKGLDMQLPISLEQSQSIIERFSISLILDMHAFCVRVLCANGFDTSHAHCLPFSTRKWCSSWALAEAYAKNLISFGHPHGVQPALPTGLLKRKGPTFLCWPHAGASARRLRGRMAGLGSNLQPELCQESRVVATASQALTSSAPAFLYIEKPDL